MSGLQGGSKMGTLFQDLRHAIRMLRKSLGFTLVAVVSLAIGISANTTIFSAINAVLLRRPPYPDSDWLVTAVTTPLKQWGAQYPVSPADMIHWRKESQVFDQLEAAEWITEGSALSGAGVPERIGVQQVTPGLFPLLGVSSNRHLLPAGSGSSQGVTTRAICSGG
jgi:putative ABC transport system permease protein